MCALRFSQQLAEGRHEFLRCTTLLAADDYSEEELAALSVMGMNKPS